MPRWWDRFLGREETRSIDSLPWNYGGSLTSSRQVSHERALRLGPVFAAHRHLADTAATLPLHGYRRLGDTRQPMGTLPQLFQFLDDEGNLVDWITQCVLSLAGHGNAIGIVTSRDGFGFPTAVKWRPRPEFFVDDDNPGRAQWYWKGRQIDRDQLFHIPWLTVPGKTLGLSPLEAFALTVNGGLAAQQYGADWFKAGGVPPGTFKNTAKTVNQPEAETIKARLVSAIRTREPIVYGSDWDYNPIVISPEQAQFVETQKLTANQIAAIYGIEPEEIGGEAANSLTYSNEEHRQTKRLANIRPWLYRMETAFASVLPERQYVKFRTAAAISADLKTRHEVYKLQRDIGMRNVDELRALEDEQPLPNGQGSDYTPLAVLAQQAKSGVIGGMTVPATVTPLRRHLEGGQ